MMACLYDLDGLRGTTRDYEGLQWTTMDYNGLRQGNVFFYDVNERILLS